MDGVLSGAAGRAPFGSADRTISVAGGRVARRTAWLAGGVPPPPAAHHLNDLHDGRDGEAGQPEPGPEVRPELPRDRDDRDVGRRDPEHGRGGHEQDRSGEGSDHHFPLSPNSWTYALRIFSCCAIHAGNWSGPM